MSTSDPFQELVDSLRKVLLRSPATTSPVSPSESAPSTSSHTVPSSPMARLAPYSGRAEECNRFLLQCSLVFTMQPALYPTDQSQIAFIISLLTGLALQWAETLWLQDGPATRSIRAFTAHFKEVFGQSDSDITAGAQLYHLKQSTMSIQEYSLKFRTLAAASGWNERSLLTTYRLDLEPKLRLQLAAHDDHQGLEKFIQHSIRCSDHMSSYQTETVAAIPALLRSLEGMTPPEPASEPMILDSGKLSSTERQRRLTRGLCMYCGTSGHLRLNCPSRLTCSWVSVVQSDAENLHPLTTKVQITSTHSVSVTALLDSGSAGNFILGTLCRQLKLRTFTTSSKYQIHSITGELLSQRRIQHKCDAIILQVGLFHRESIQLLVLEGATVDVILGRPWLVKHDPILSWGTGERASQLPPHRPWDCAIDLVPDAPLPRGRIYPLSLPESKVLQKLREYQLYLKAEKCSFHQSSIHFLGYIIDRHGVRMDEGKVDAVIFWPEPKSIKELQRFLGFANFYRRFIKGYSQITSSLTNLFKGHPKALIWTSEASTAFQTLKQAFTQAPLLTHPDPDLPFVVEVDASSTGVGTVLSQYHGTPARLHPCAYFSWKLSPAETNYDIGNLELLAIKLALEEWRHWLEGAAHLFHVFTDHKNLQYLRDAKRLCPRQARWALFFTRFHFSISYRPGSKNVRADALSRLSEPEEMSETPSNIIPTHLIVSPIEWTSPPVVPTPEPRTLPGCPPGHQFIPRTQRVDLIHSTHVSLGTGHPGANNTLSLLSERFWWPDMARDVRRYVRGCKECAMSKSPRHLPAGKLHPLPIPNLPWSHLGVDFMTDLPSSDGNTCILVIVDRFSKFCHLLPLKGLPTAMETAECLFNHVFRYYGIPEDTVSDRGPQFISRVWKSFFKLLGVTVSLSSGYHPQTNGQTERKIQEVGRFLRTFCHSHQNSWNQFLGWAEYAQNSLRQPSTGLTPFQCVLGFQPPLFPWNGEPSDVPAVDHWFRESERVWDNAHLLQRAVRSTRDIRLRLPSKKLSPRFVGPFTILEQVNPVTYKLQRPPQYRIHPTFHVSLLKPCHEPLLPSTEACHEEEPPPPMVLEEGSIYSVKEILMSQRRGGHLEYLIDWEGFGPEERSWVPLSPTSSMLLTLNIWHLEEEGDHLDAGEVSPQEQAVGRG
ncbi:hypothetical protein M9458_043372, partial [Cirrhinus mrigala]